MVEIAYENTTELFLFRERLQMAKLQSSLEAVEGTNRMLPVKKKRLHRKTVHRSQHNIHMYMFVFFL